MSDSGPQAVDHPSPKIIQIPRPSAILRGETVIPPVPIAHNLTIIQEIIGEFGCDPPRLTKHQQSSPSGTDLRTIKPQRLNTKQKILIRQPDPWMVRTPALKLPTIRRNTIGVQRINAHIFDNCPIQRKQITIPKHGMDRFPITQIIAITIAPIRTLHRIRPHVYGKMLPCRARNINGNDVTLRSMANHHIVIAQHDGTDLRRIMHRIPKILHHFPSVIDSSDIQRMIFMLGHAKQNQPTFGVGKRTICFPQTVRQPTFGALRFQTVTFTHPRNLSGPPGIVMFITVHRHHHLTYHAIYTHFAAALPS